MLDEFSNRSGAIINGKATAKIGKIDIRAIGPSFCFVRADPLDKMETVTLEEIDDWRLSRMKAIGLDATDLKIEKKQLAEIFQGIVVGPIFSAPKSHGG